MARELSLEKPVKLEMTARSIKVSHLGGTGKEKGKRHPTLQNNVLVATGAKVLGSITIGENSKVGAGSVVLKDVPTNSTVVGIPGVVVIQDGVKVKRNLDHQDLPDPFADRCKEMENKIEELQKEIRRLNERKREKLVMTIQIFNTLKREKEPFIPMEEGKG